MGLKKLINCSEVKIPFTRDFNCFGTLGGPMSKRYIFIYEHITLGGAQTLLFRMAKWLKENENCEVLVICKKEEENSLETGLLDCGVEIEYLQKLCKKQIYNCLTTKKRLASNDFIVFNFDIMLAVEEVCQRIKKEDDIKANLILYVVHPHTLIFGNNLKNAKLKRLVKEFYKNIINAYIDNRNIAFMDETTISSTEEFYKLRVIDDDNRIFRLPMYLCEYNEEKIKARWQKKDFNILTIARADFPFKGYIFGLIDDYERLQNKYGYLRITIITYGPGVEELNKKINCLPEQTRNGIYLVGRIPYEELGYYFEKANLFIGMGTTVLDAANYGIPSIVIHPYTYKNIAEGYFYERPFVLGSSENNVSAIDLIENVINMDENEYLDICNKSYNALKATYEIGVIMQRFIKYRNIDFDNIISKYALKAHSALFYLNSTRRKLFNSRDKKM